MPAGCPGVNPEILTPSGYPRSCCSKPGWRRSSPTSCAGWNASRICQRWHRAICRMCWSPGRDWDITPAPETCIKLPGLIAADYDGKIPDQYEELIKLPGIGPSSAADILSVAYGKDLAALDGNIKRVLARLFNMTDILDSPDFHCTVPGSSGTAPARREGRRFQPGDDGPGRNYLPAKESRLRGMPVDGAIARHFCRVFNWTGRCQNRAK